MEGEDRRLHREPQEEQEEHQRLLVGWDPDLEQTHELEAVALTGGRGEVSAQQQDADKHQRRADGHVADVLKRRPVPLGSRSPAGDEEPARHQLDHEEEPEHDQVERGERTDQRRLEREDRRGVVAKVALAAVDGVDDHQQSEQSGERDEQQAHPVDPEVPADAEHRG